MIIRSRHRPLRSQRRLIASFAVVALVAASCGGDDDDTAETATTSAEADAQVDGGGDGNEDASSPAVTATDPEVPVEAGASGTATFVSGDTTISGEITECTLADPDVSLVAEGENAGFQVFSEGGGSVGVVVTGMVEWEGSGTASISGGSVTITGAGSPPDDSTVTEDFTIDAEIGTS